MSSSTEPVRIKSVSVIVPVCNEPPEILRQINSLVDLDGVLEVIVVDASEPESKGNLMESLNPSVILIHSDIAGRAVQMNFGSRQASGDILWFVHADTSVPINAAQTISRFVTSDHPWGRFDVRFRSSVAKMRLVANMMNLRSTLTKICTGDQAIFVDRVIFEKIGGFPQIAIMEDIALSRKLKSSGSMVRVRTPVETSARRWEIDGYMRTIALMSMMRLLYWSGVSPTRLAKLYKQVH